MINLNKIFLMTSIVFTLSISCLQKPFSPDNSPDIVTDCDGNVYKTVRIGTQIWTTQNFRSTKFNDGSIIPMVNDSTTWINLTAPGFCYYNNTTNQDTIERFGALYNYYTIASCELAPAGWHVPTDADWDTLTKYLITNGYNWDGTNVGNKIGKSIAAKTDWSIAIGAGNGAVGADLTTNNRSGFSGLPGGYRGGQFGSFQRIGDYGIWWGTTDTDTKEIYYRHLYSEYDSLFKVMMYSKSIGLSVRLVKD